MPLTKYDPDYARGARGPAPAIGRGAWQNILEVRKAALMLEKKLKAFLFDSEERDRCLLELDAVLVYAEGLIARYDRSGPPEVQTELGDMEATLRLASKFPEHFKAFDVDGLKKQAAGLRRRVA